MCVVVYAVGAVTETVVIDLHMHELVWPVDDLFVDNIPVFTAKVFSILKVWALICFALNIAPRTQNAVVALSLQNTCNTTTHLSKHHEPQIPEHSPI